MSSPESSADIPDTQSEMHDGFGTIDFRQGIRNIELIKLGTACEEFSRHCGRLGFKPGKSSIYHTVRTDDSTINVAATPISEIPSYGPRRPVNFLHLSVSYFEPDPQSSGEQHIRIYDYLSKGDAFSVQSGEAWPMWNEMTGERVIAFPPGSPPIVQRNEQGFYRLYTTPEYELAEPRPIDTDTDVKKVVLYCGAITALNVALAMLSEQTIEVGV